MQEYIGNDNRGNAENQKYCSRNEEWFEGLISKETTHS
jgi:hypothetical protein